MEREQTDTARQDAPRTARQWVPDPAQSPDALIDHHKRVAASPAAHARYADQVREKAAREGVIHVDLLTGYRARFKPGEPPDDNGDQAEAGRRPAGSGRRDSRTRDERAER